MQIKFNPALFQTQNLQKMWQSINGLIYQRIPKGLKVLPAKLSQCGALG